MRKQGESASAFRHWRMPRPANAMADANKASRGKVMLATGAYNWRRWLAAIMVAAGLTLAGAIAPTSAFAASSINGTVEDTSGTPQTGVAVNVIDPSTDATVTSATTDASGSFGVSVNSGTYNVQFIPPSVRPAKLPGYRRSHRFRTADHHLEDRRSSSGAGDVDRCAGEHVRPTSTRGYVHFPAEPRQPGRTTVGQLLDRAARRPERHREHVRRHRRLRRATCPSTTCRSAPWTTARPTT